MPTHLAKEPGASAINPLITGTHPINWINIPDFSLSQLSLVYLFDNQGTLLASAEARNILHYGLSNDVKALARGVTWANIPFAFITDLRELYLDVVVAMKSTIKIDQVDGQSFAVVNILRSPRQFWKSAKRHLGFRRKTMAMPLQEENDKA